MITKCAGTGLYVDIKGKGPVKGKNFCIALRADIDALPMKEKNQGLSYRSTFENAAHMCGHDGHTTCLLGGIAKLLDNIN